MLSKLTNKDLAIHQLQQISEKREDAILITKENCHKLKNYITYGVPTVIERMPNASTSVLKSSSSTNHHDIKCDVITDELNDYNFIDHMKSLIFSLPETYKETFISVFIDCRPISTLYRTNIYTLLNRGYLKLAILDTSIEYYAEDELNYQNLKVSHNTRKKQIIKKMKANLYNLHALYLSGQVEIIKDEKTNLYSLKNHTINKEQFTFYDNIIQWINEFHSFGSSSMDSKEAIMKLIMDTEWKYLSTSDRRSITKGMLALAYLDKDIDYTYEELKYDASEYFISTSFLVALKNFQLQLPI